MGFDISGWIAVRLRVGVAVGALGATALSVAHADHPTGKVVGITDGDTITVLIDRQPIKVRLAEIDTPEKGQPWANRAKKALSGKVFGQVVEFQVVDTDRYGRTVAKVFLNGRGINRERVREGHAWVYRKYLRDRAVLDDEREPREADLGLWVVSKVDELPPCEWRQGGLTRSLIA